ncbi:hypothetical protein AAC387_Pa04g1531 [Persea americana]
MESSIAFSRNFDDPMLQEMVNVFIEPPKKSLEGKFEMNVFLQTTKSNSMESCLTSCQNSDDVIATACSPLVLRDTEIIYSKKLLVWFHSYLTPLPPNLKDSCLKEEESFSMVTTSHLGKELVVQMPLAFNEFIIDTIMMVLVYCEEEDFVWDLGGSIFVHYVYSFFLFCLTTDSKSEKLHN